MTVKPSPLPSFLIVGAMRSGTTSLYRYLDEHPEVFLAKAKEVHFFDDQYQLGLGWYAEQFSKGVGFLQIGEATPNYIYEPGAIGRISKDLPSARLLIILRNPVERAYSHYLHNRVRGKESLTFSEALAIEPERLQRSGLDRRTYSYIDRGRYHDQLTNLFEHFNSASTLVLVFDDLVTKPKAVYQQVCEFLDVDPNFVPRLLGESINPYTEFRSVAIRRLGKGLPSPVGRLLGRVNAKRHVGPPKQSLQTRGTLVSALAGDIRATSTLIGRDLVRLWLE